METVQNLIDIFYNGELQYLRVVVLIAGIFFLGRFTLKVTVNVFVAFKTFILPLIWPRNFPREYGPWAGTYFKASVS